MVNATIEVMGISKYFNGTAAVENISLNVNKGEVLGLIGPNGAGKTTTMRVITGFLKPESGVVAICGVNMESNPELAKSYIGYLPEGAPLYYEMTPLQLLTFSAQVHKIKKQQIKNKINTVIQQLALKEVLHQPIATLSKGFKRRVALAQAILHSPKVLILDEPTDGLDPIQKIEAHALIKHLSQSTAIIISTHNLEDIHKICTHTALISQGKIIQESTTKELTSNNKYKNIEDYFISNLSNVSTHSESSQ